jgi:NAD(P)H-dependent flavin oxidoreductase YrpB (nitropropane dioxygenase family)
VLKTQLTAAIGIAHTVIQAGMGAECGARIAAAACRRRALA